MPTNLHQKPRCRTATRPHALVERRSPAFFGNLAHLLVGPLWVLNRTLRLRPTQVKDAKD
jgi:hypothetical protein